MPSISEKITGSAVALCDQSPFLRRMAWRWWYGNITRQVDMDTWTFMNYGFVPALSSSTLPTLKLDPADEPDRLCIQLYERVVSPVSLEGKEVLEVGSGRGGGASYIARYHHPARCVGVDFSPQLVAFAARHQKNYQENNKNVEFIVGDAESLPFPDGSFDAVINVESSHCYGNVRKFFDEAARVLRLGGFLLFADLREASAMKSLKAMLIANPRLELVEEEDITANVLASLEADNVRKRGLIEKHVPPRMRHVFEEFAGVSDGTVFRNLQKRNLLYCRFALRRRG